MKTARESFAETIFWTVLALMFIGSIVSMYYYNYGVIFKQISAVSFGNIPPLVYLGYAVLTIIVAAILMRKKVALSKTIGCVVILLTFAAVLIFWLNKSPVLFYDLAITKNFEACGAGLAFLFGSFTFMILFLGILILGVYINNAIPTKPKWPK